MRPKDYLLYNLDIIDSDREKSNLISLDKYRNRRTSRMFISIDVKDLNIEVTSPRRGRYDTIEAVGGSLRELVNDATVFIVNGKGQQVGFMAVSDSPHAKELIDRVSEKFKSLQEMK